MSNAAENEQALNDYTALCSLSELPEGEARVFAVSELVDDDSLEHLEELKIAVARCGEIVYAIEDRCSHDNGPLGHGPVAKTVNAEGEDRAEITCVRHGGRFDLSTGKATSMPAITPVQVFPVRIVDGKVEVDLSDA